MLNLVLVLAVLAILLFIVLGVIVLVYLGLKRSKDREEKLTVMVSSESGSPLGGVDVKLGERIAATDSYGKAQFEVPRGEHELLIIADGHADFSQTVRAGDRKILHAKLSLEKPSPEMRRLEKAIAEARRGMDEIGSSYNPTIPDFLFSVCLSLHKLALEEARAQQDKKPRLEALRSAETAISQIAKGMVERRNLSLYAKAKGRKEKAPPVPEPRQADLVDAKKKLAGVDFLITRLTGRNAIYPPLVLWKTAQALLSEPTVFRMRLAVLLLDSAEKMIIELGDYLA